MLILLPPSETKRDGGEGAALSTQLSEKALAFPELNPVRNKVITAVVALAKDPVACAKALKLSAKQMSEVHRNKVVKKSATMPAIDRYTGVLYDALDAASLPEQARNFLGSSVLIQSALLGPVGALDLIPAYRLSFDSKLPNLTAGTLKKAWAQAGAKALARREGLILDLRSEGYAALAPLAPAENTFYLRVVTRGENGEVRALNHFNKKGKGEFVRALALDAATVSSFQTARELMQWGDSHGMTLEQGKASEGGWLAELNLVVSGTL